MAKYLDNDGLLYFWQKIKGLFVPKSEAVKAITRSGTTFTATMADGTTTFTFDQQDSTVEKTSTTPKANGTAAVGSETKYAAGDHVHPAQTSVSGNAGTATALQTGRKIDGVSFDGTADIIHFGTSSTAASTATKEVDCTGYSLATGSWIAVKFSVTNTATASNLQLKVGSTTAKAIKYRGSALPSASILSANRLYFFVYDGTNYELIGDLDTTYAAATETPLMDGTGAVGTATKYAREDHVHPSDTTKVDKVSGKGLSTNDYTTEEKTKLGNIEAGAEVNQNAFANIKIGSTTIAADAKGDTFEIVAGTNVTLTPDATNDKVTITAASTEFEASSPISISSGTISHDTSGVTAASKGDTSNQTPGWGSTFKVPSGTVNATGHLTAFADHTVKIPDSVASGSAKGLMSSAHYTKLEGLPDAAALASTYATKSDITAMYKYKGSVATAAALPSSGQTTGDVYNIEAASTYGGAGMNVAWNGTTWDPLGEIFAITSISNGDIDTIVAA